MFLRGLQVRLLLSTELDARKGYGTAELDLIWEGGWTVSSGQVWRLRRL